MNAPGVGGTRRRHVGMFRDEIAFCGRCHAATLHATTRASSAWHSPAVSGCAMGLLLLSAGPAEQHHVGWDDRLGNQRLSPSLLLFCCESAMTETNLVDKLLDMISRLMSDLVEAKG